MYLVDKKADEAIRMADRSNSEFVALLAHELRGPLSAISNCIVALRHTQTSIPTAQASLAILERQANQMKRIINESDYPVLLIIPLGKL